MKEMTSGLNRPLPSASAANAVAQAINSLTPTLTGPTVPRPTPTTVPHQSTSNLNHASSLLSPALSIKVSEIDPQLIKETALRIQQQLSLNSKSTTAASSAPPTPIIHTIQAAKAAKAPAAISIPPTTKNIAPSPVPAATPTAIATVTSTPSASAPAPKAHSAIHSTLSPHAPSFVSQFNSSSELACDDKPKSYADILKKANSGEGNATAAAATTTVATPATSQTSAVFPDPAVLIQPNGFATQSILADASIPVLKTSEVAPTTMVVTRTSAPASSAPTISAAVAPQSSSNKQVAQKKFSLPSLNKSIDLQPSFARCFVIKSFSEDDVHKCIKYGVWASTDTGNRRLESAYTEADGKGPVYLFFSVNASGQFCGMARMVSHVDFGRKFGAWTQDKWSGEFKVEWIYVKDVPNRVFRHITLPNNENKPVTNSRDTQEIPFSQAKDVLKLFKEYSSKTSILDDFAVYDDRESKMEQRKNDPSAAEDIRPELVLGPRANKATATGNGSGNAQRS
jgi:hypothetical protein